MQRCGHWGNYPRRGIPDNSSLSSERHPSARHIIRFCWAMLMKWLYWIPLKFLYLNKIIIGQVRVRLAYWWFRTIMTHSQLYWSKNTRETRAQACEQTQVLSLLLSLSPMGWQLSRCQVKGRRFDMLSEARGWIMERDQAQGRRLNVLLEAWK